MNELEYKRMSDRLDVIEKDMKQVGGAVFKIEKALLGDEYGNDGIVKKIKALQDHQERFEEQMIKRYEELEEKMDGRIKSLENSRSQLKWTVAGWTTGAMAAGGGLIALFKKMFNI